MLNKALECSFGNVLEISCFEETKVQEGVSDVAKVVLESKNSKRKLLLLEEIVL